MRLRKPNSQPAEAAVSTLRRVLVEVVSIVREMVRIPADLFMRVAEAAGAAVLLGWGVVWPWIQRGWRLAGRVLAWAEREVTPARGIVVVAGTVAVLLALSQFAAYRVVSIGVPDYAYVDAVAPPPPVDQADAGTAHLWLGIPLGLLALGIVYRAATGRWQAARLLIGVGLAVVVLSLAIDLPKGLDEGEAAVAYEGASAKLLGGFWMQLSAGVVLIVLAPLMTRLLEPRARAAAANAPRRTQPISRALPGAGRLRLPMPASRSPRGSSSAAARTGRTGETRRPRLRVGRPAPTREAGS